MANHLVTWEEFKKQLLADPEVKKEYDKLEPEFQMARALIALRERRGLTQRQFADRIGMSQSQLARIESGKQNPKLETLTRIARSAGYAVEVNFIPIEPASDRVPLSYSITINDPAEETTESSPASF